MPAGDVLKNQRPAPALARAISDFPRQSLTLLYQTNLKLFCLQHFSSKSYPLRFQIEPTRPHQIGFVSSKNHLSTPVQIGFVPLNPVRPRVAPTIPPKPDILVSISLISIHSSQTRKEGVW
jgi:hypothetical protein